MTTAERETLMEIACEMCRFPYTCRNKDELAEECDHCRLIAEMYEMEDDSKPIIFNLEIPKERLDELVKKAVEELQRIQNRGRPDDIF